MMVIRKVLDGNSLSVEDINDLVNDVAVQIDIDETALEAVGKAEKFLKSEINKKIIYGVNTGFGPMASHILGSNHLVDLQYNLIRSHAVGMGEPISDDYVLAAMVVRLNTLVKGFSGVSVDLIKHLQAFINHRILPVIPEHGAVGTSGDLVQLSHIALALIGEGEVRYLGQRSKAHEVMKKLDLQPYKLKPKEGLALINGTSVMSGISSVVHVNARKLLSLAVRAGALAMELSQARFDAISERLMSLRPHEGQMRIAFVMREILKTSSLLRDREMLKKMINTSEDVKQIPEAIQEIYSLRCIPQILGPVFDAIKRSMKDLTVEINSVTDNPIVDENNEQFLHGGNFHGEQVASMIDLLKISLVKLTILSERRINFFLNHNINKFFPPFLNLEKPGLTLALQGLQFVATSTTAQSQSLAYPHSIHSISTNADNQDVVSMGTDASLIAAKVVENAYTVLTIELLVLCQAIDYFDQTEDLCDESRSLFWEVRKVFPKIQEDRVVIEELKELQELFKNKSFGDIDWNF